MITFQNVALRYPQAKRRAVEDVSLAAAKGRVTAIAGPNGSGKSTLVRALLGRVPCESGAITVSGQDVAALERREIARAVAVVTQREEPVFPMQVRDYVGLGRYPHGGPFSGRTTADLTAIERAIDRADVRQFADRVTETLSGGEWQRVRIARALAQGGEAIVLDEPTTFLDIAHEMAVFELLDSLAREGHAVLLVSHQLNLVARFSDHIVLVHEGRVAAAGTPPDVMRADVLERVYHWPLVVSRDAAVGAPFLVPLRGRGTR